MAQIKMEQKTKRALGFAPDSQSLNTHLDVLHNKAFEARQYLIEKDKAVSATNIKNILTGEHHRKWKLLQLFKDHNREMKTMIGKDVVRGTWTNFNTSFNHVSEFLKQKYLLDDIGIMSLDLIFAKRFYNWLRKIKNLNHNSALKNIANLKKIVITCLDNGWLLDDPFLRFKSARDEVEIVYLTKEELETIANKSISNERLSRVRDLFIFCCFTGLSFIDLKQLKRSEIEIDSKGVLRIYKGRKKTGTVSIIPLLPIAQNILLKYKKDNELIGKDLLLPVLTNQKYNAYLKEIGDISSIDKVLSSKIARNTFATTITLANNVPIETISKMMGHKSLKQTQHYAKVLAVKVSEDMSLLKKRFAKRNFLVNYIQTEKL